MDFTREMREANDCLLQTVDETRLRLSWENLTVRTSSKSSRLVEKFLIRSKETKRDSIEILKSASGYAEAGQMIAIMGPSGAGKTTLLGALANKIRPTSGTISVNGIEPSIDEITKISSYVPQYDPLPATLTASEYIDFSCALRLDGGVTSLQRKALAHDIIRNLNLCECKDSLICTLSGGEKKRLSLAAEIVTKPKILFLDEPTTGLDTSAALRVIESIEPISATGIVMCSIHQPSMMIYNLFSHVIFLSNGKTAFSGSLEDARTFFESEGFRCPVGFDEAEYYVKIITNRVIENFKCTSLITDLENDEEYSTKIFRAYAESDLSKIMPRNYEALKVESSPKRPPWIVQFNWLTWRLWHENRRTIVDDLIAFNYYAISIGLVAIFFWGIDTRQEDGIADVMGVFYMTSAETIFSTAYTPLCEIERDIPIFMREATMYCPSAYYIATFVSWIPKTLLKSFLLTIMLIAILKTSETIFQTFIRFLGCTIASGICGLSYGSMIASLIDDNEMATIVMVPIDLIAMLMSGIYYNLRTIEWYTVGFKYLSIFYYTNEALAIAHWSRINDTECESDGNSRCISSGSEVLLRYGYAESNYWLDIMGMIFLAIIMNFIGCIGMRRRRYLKSKY